MVATSSSLRLAAFNPSSGTSVVVVVVGASVVVLVGSNVLVVVSGCVVVDVVQIVVVVDTDVETDRLRASSEPAPPLHAPAVRASAAAIAVRLGCAADFT